MEKYFNISVIAHDFFFTNGASWKWYSCCSQLFKMKSQKTKTCIIIIKTKSLHILFTLIFVQLDDYSLSINGNQTPKNWQGHVMKSIFKNIYFSLLKPWNGQYMSRVSHTRSCVCCVACFWECMDPRHKHFLWLSRAPRRPLWSLLDALLICSCVFGRHPRASFFILNFRNALNVFTLWINSHGVFRSNDLAFISLVRLFLVLGVKVHIAGYIFYFKLIYNLVWK